jgi:hypothetical protein
VNRTVNFAVPFKVGSKRTLLHLVSLTQIHCYKALGTADTTMSGVRK